MRRIFELLKIADVKSITIFSLVLLAVISSFFAIVPTNILGEISQRIIFLLSEGRGIDQIKTILIVYFIILVCGTIIRNVFCYLSSKFSNSIVFKIRNKSYSKLLKINNQRLNSMDMGLVTNMVFNNIERLELIFSTSLFTMLSDILDLLIMSIFIIKIDPIILVILLSVTPFTYYIAKKSGQEQKKLAIKKIASETNIINNLNDSYNNIDYIRVYYGEKREVDRFEDVTNDYRAISNMSDKKLSSFYVIEKTCRILGTVIALSYLTSNIINGKADTGSFLVIAMYSEKFFAPITNMIRYFQYLQKGFASIDNILEFLREENFKKYGFIEYKDIAPYLIFGEDLEVSVNGNKVATCNKFYIKDKTINLIEGDNGSGKSSLLKGLLGIYSIEKGRFYADNKFRNSEKLFSYSQQNAKLFNLSVIENCLYPLDLESADPNTIENVKELLCNLNFDDEQFYKIAGENGSELSGGEQKKITFIRSLINPAPLIILDEITSNIDINSIKVMEECIVDESKKRAVILITHQISDLIDSNTNNRVKIERSGI
ncbi:ABC transporter transmembrane domain-containing protein [Clostridium algidicarnis]|uniref:ABC transporter transmembrane domain-containing protein n=1 Tax=Clostridium algidicarnis TaxID=37659 RepID=UPI001625EC66|nr:ABC transporter ATP-binding protein [Clostridium algidicarnis]MBB6630329.1 ABC transporter ATP-binding protein [Clostridium algidicarnis]